MPRRARLWFVLATIVAGAAGWLYGSGVVGVPAAYGLTFVAVFIAVRGVVILEEAQHRRRHGPD